MQSFGIDVSKWQGNFNFEKAKKEGITFAILKAGGSDSGRYKDKKFEQFYSDCKKLSIPVGAYYFGNDKTVEDAKKSAEHFASLLANKQFDLPVYYDVEGAMLRIPKKSLTDIIVAFCQTVKKYGYKVGIYTSQSVFNNQVEDYRLLDYSHWVARWSKAKPSGLNSKANIDIWQFGGETNLIRTNKVAGVTCDQDYCYVDFGQNEGVAPKPTPTPAPVKPTKPSTIVTPVNPNAMNQLGKQKCPEPIPGSIDFNLLDYSNVFDVNYYRAMYPDLKKNGCITNAQLIRHFFEIGSIKEARKGNYNFDPKVYKKKNPDLAEIFGDDWKWYYAHFICCGQREGRECV